jgi:hypothetical protein
MLFLYFHCRQSSRNAYADRRNMSPTSKFEHFDAEIYRFDVAWADLSYPFALFLACNWLLSVTDVNWIVSDAYSNRLITWWCRQFRGPDIRVMMGDQSQNPQNKYISSFLWLWGFICDKIWILCITLFMLDEGKLQKWDCKSQYSLWKQCHWSWTMCKISLHNAYFLAWFIRIMLWNVRCVYLIAFECFYSCIGYINSQFDQFTCRKMYSSLQYISISKQHPLKRIRDSYWFQMSIETLCDVFTLSNSSFDNMSDKATAGFSNSDLQHSLSDQRWYAEVVCRWMPWYSSRHCMQVVQIFRSMSFIIRIWRIIIKF